MSDPYGYDGSSVNPNAFSTEAQPTEQELYRIRLHYPPPKKPRPRIVCLCGSTRFRELYRKVNAAETMAGNIVLSVGCFAGDPEWGTNKVNLDELHKRKIDLADEVVVLTVDSYIGASTRSEIDYATAQGKPLRYINETT